MGPLKYTLIAILWLCTGCSQYTAIAKDETAKAADEALNVAIWGQCNGASLGAFRRRYSDEAERTEELKRCDKETNK